MVLPHCAVPTLLKTAWVSLWEFCSAMNQKILQRKPQHYVPPTLPSAWMCNRSDSTKINPPCLSVGTSFKAEAFLRKNYLIVIPFNAKEQTR